MLNALAAFDHKANFRLQAAHIGAGFVQQALGLVHLVTRSVMGLTHRFQIGFNVTQIGHAAFQCVHRAGGFGLYSRLVGNRLGTLQKPLLLLLARKFGLQALVFLGDLGLLFQLLQVRIELAQNVLNPRQVLTRAAA